MAGDAAGCLLLAPQLGLSTGALPCGFPGGLGFLPAWQPWDRQASYTGAPGPTAGVPVCKVPQTALQNATWTAVEYILHIFQMRMLRS